MRLLLFLPLFCLTANGQMGIEQPFFATPASTGCSFPQDDMESYTAYSAVNGLNGGCGWDSAYADANNTLGYIASDDMEAYAADASVNGLNKGDNFTAAYVDTTGS